MGNDGKLHEERLVERLLNSFEISLEAENRREKTLTQYLGTARSFVKFCRDRGLPEPQQCRREHVELWLRDLHQRMRPHSVRSLYTALRAFFRWLEEEEELAGPNPMLRVRKPAVDEVVKDIVPEADLVRMFRHLEKGKRWRDACVVAILYDTGVRAGELVALDLEDLDLRTGIIVVRLSKSRRARMVRISKKGLVYVDRYLRRRDDQHSALILGRMGRMTTSGVLQLVKRLFGEIGVEGVGPHDLRHTSASHSVGQLNESEMMELYGWKSSEMVRHYARQRLQQSALEAHERSSPLERLGEGRPA